MAAGKLAQWWRCPDFWFPNVDRYDIALQFPCNQVGTILFFMLDKWLGVIIALFSLSNNLFFVGNVRRRYKLINWLVLNPRLRWEHVFKWWLTRVCFHKIPPNFTSFQYLWNIDEQHCRWQRWVHFTEFYIQVFTCEIYRLAGNHRVKIWSNLPLNELLEYFYYVLNYK